MKQRNLRMLDDTPTVPEVQPAPEVMSNLGGGGNVRDRIILSGPFRAIGGRGWILTLPADLQLLGDTNNAAYQSRLVLLENGIALGPGHARHDLINTAGGGHYSHWYNDLYLSTSDNTDPNINGRVYSVTLATQIKTERPAVFAFGSCQLLDPILDLNERHLAREVHVHTLSTSNFTHTIEEHLQLTRFYRNKLPIQRALLRHIAGDLDFDPGVTCGGELDTAEVVLLELCTPIRMMFGSFALNRNRTFSVIVEPAMGLGTAANDAAQRWFWSGLARADHAETQAGARELLKYLPRGTEEAEIDRAIVAEAVSYRSDPTEIAAGIEALQREFRRPLGIITHVLRYMPDGRPLLWPADFLSQVNDICRRLDVPVINPCRLVLRHGVESGMTEDMSHYTRSFVRVVADEFLPFIKRVKAHGYDPDQPGRRLGIPLSSG